MLDGCNTEHDGEGGRKVKQRFYRGWGGADQRRIYIDNATSEGKNTTFRSHVQCANP